MRPSCGRYGGMLYSIEYFKKNLLKISFQQNFEFSKSVERLKSYNVFPSMYKKKFKNDQDVCWLVEDYMEMKKIVRDQSKNYFHLTPKIDSLWGVWVFGSVCHLVF